MRTLRDFLLAETRINEGGEDKSPRKKPKPEPKSNKEENVPPGFQGASVSGSLTKIGVQVIKSLGGEEAKYSQIKFSDVQEQHIRTQFGVSTKKINDLRDLVGRRGLFSSAKGAKIMQELFLASEAAAKKHKGVGGYILKMDSDWAKIGGTSASSQKLVMFWLNALYNVYVKGNLDNVKLRFWFSNDSVLVMEP